MRIILASKSPRRIELLKQLVNDFEIIPSDLDENSIKEVCRDPYKLVEKLAISKTEDVFSKEDSNDEDLIVIGGDTLVYIDGEILGKPNSEEDAFNTLAKLQGKTNQVYTGMGIMIKKDNNSVKEVYVSKADVKMREMSKEDILEYIATGEPMDKAGSYAIQGIGSKYIDSVKGSYNGVVGLDIDALKKVLEKYI